MNKNENISPIKVFVSFAHADKGYKDTLLKHLVLLVRRKNIQIWSYDNIVAGEHWENKILENLRTADVAILLISPDFLASDFINDFEIPKMLERYDKNELVLVPVIIRSVLFAATEISKLQGLPRDGKPISMWSNKDEAWISVVQELSKIFDKLVDRQSSTFNEEERLKDIYKNVRNLISHGKIKEALNEIEIIAEKKGDKDLLNSLIMIKGRFLQLERSSMLGIIAHSESMIERNKINYSLLNLVETL